MQCGNVVETITIGSKEVSIGSYYQVTAQKNIDFKTSKGNIVLKTMGEFPLMQDGAVTVEGFNNIGTKGNIQLISTFGNIDLECIENSDLADFSTNSTVVPWNPSFYLKMNEYFPDLDITKVLNQGLNFPTDITDFGGFVSFFTNLPNLAIYDGLPVFLPTKMILQNPNIDLPQNDLDYSWIPKFRSEPSDWRKITNKEFWKIPGKLMGNITISTWSGDINISTDSKLGCAGNININASQSAGTLPGYKIGTVDIKANANKRIYPDPRDLFFDSNFELRMAGQLQLFTHGGGLVSVPKPVLPKAADAVLKSVGFTFNWATTDYDDFYKSYALNVVVKGNILNASLTSSPVVIAQVAKLLFHDGPTLGCTRCITDYLLGIPGVQDICYATENLQDIGVDGIHRYGFSKFSPIYKDYPRGTFNILSLSFDKISIGDGHAIDTQFTTRQLTGPNMGSVNIQLNGDLTENIGRNFYFKSSLSLDEDKQTQISYVCTEKYLDDVWPSIIQTAINLPNKIWNSTFGKIITIQDGQFILGKAFMGGILKVQTGLAQIDLPFPENKLYIVGYDNIMSKKIGQYQEYAIDQLSGIIDFGFDLTKCAEYVMNPAKFAELTMNFGSIRKVSKLMYDGSKYESSDETSTILTLDFKKLELEFNNNQTYIHSDSFLNNKDQHAGYEKFNLTWNPTMTLLFPHYYWRYNDTHIIQDGHGYSKNASYDFYEYHELTNMDIVKSLFEAADSYIDYVVDEDVSVMEDTPGSRGIIDATIKPRDILITTNYYAGQRIKDDITWTAPVNSKIFVLNSDSYIIDDENQKYISFNNYQILLNGNLDKPSPLDIQYLDYSQEKHNTFEIKNDVFNKNLITFTNESSSSGAINYYLIFNGNNANGENTKDSQNEILIYNGTNTNDSTNTISVENGSQISGDVQLSGSTNQMYIFNGNNLSSSVSKFRFDNGTSTSDSENEFQINNGIKSEYSENNFELNNGIETQISKNNFQINNGDENSPTEQDEEQINQFTINCGNGYNSYSLSSKFWYDSASQESKFQSVTNEYSASQRYINVEDINQENIGEMAILNTQVRQVNASISVTTNAPVITHNSCDVDEPIVTNPLEPLSFKERIHSYIEVYKKYLNDIFEYIWSFIHKEN